MGSFKVKAEKEKVEISIPKKPRLISPKPNRLPSVSIETPVSYIMYDDNSIWAKSLPEVFNSLISSIRKKNTKAIEHIVS